MNSVTELWKTLLSPPGAPPPRPPVLPPGPSRRRGKLPRRLSLPVHLSHEHTGLNWRLISNFENAREFQTFEYLQLLDSATIPLVLLLSWLFLSVRYLLSHIVGEYFTVPGLAEFRSFRVIYFIVPAITK